MCIIKHRLKLDLLTTQTIFSISWDLREGAGKGWRVDKGQRKATQVQHSQRLLFCCWAWLGLWPWGQCRWWSGRRRPGDCRNKSRALLQPCCCTCRCCTCCAGVWQGSEDGSQLVLAQPGLGKAHLGSGASRHQSPMLVINSHLFQFCEGSC